MDLGVGLIIDVRDLRTVSGTGGRTGGGFPGAVIDRRLVRTPELLLLLDPD